MENVFDPHESEEFYLDAENTDMNSITGVTESKIRMYIFKMSSYLHSLTTVE